ncbi:MAG TPA: hypothetical protein VGN90_09005 [Pyrinomonadaceae bacterium]|jgi:hypothetical protein|nr:hypothetical protein [Pyrinomonadaceae bacterium]
MSIFRIQINAGNPATYDPNPQTVFVNDSVFWFNSDPNEAHWPAPSKSDPTGFMENPVAANSSSDQVGFAAVQSIPYICNIHDGESGQINVKTPKKSPFADNTKKGAFGGKTKKGPFAGNTKKGAFGTTTK